jgi:hypothetical protein
VLDALYRSRPGNGLAIVLTDLANPSPSQGWAGQERPSLVESPADEMVIKLIGNKLPHELHPGGEEDDFRALVEASFSIEAEQTLGEGTRTLFALEPRPPDEPPVEPAD